MELVELGAFFRGDCMRGDEMWFRSPQGGAEGVNGTRRNATLVLASVEPKGPTCGTKYGFGPRRVAPKGSIRGDEMQFWSALGGAEGVNKRGRNAVLVRAWWSGRGQ